MADCRFSNRAVADLADIWRYGADAWSEEQGDAYYELLVRAALDLAAHPSRGRHYDAILPGLRGMKAGRHLVFYRCPDPETVEIVRILHERMDLKSRLNG